ncbi:MAG: glycosyltransferase family 4 protein [Thermoanaerobaculia bacterium]|nr:glycosyltransferase family 4 protein [Thermoanaerobaculia bacterium]
MRVAMLSPLPPARTGVAHYASMLLPALRERLEIVESGADRYIYQLGNNPHHEFVYEAAMMTPGVIVLHDVVLHHLIVEMTLARGDVDGYIDSLRASHGEAGAAWARGRAAGLHSEMGNFLLPASVEIARRSTAVIVHNEWAANVLRSFGVATPIHVVPHPYLPEAVVHDRDAVRRRLGIAPQARVVGLFGFLTSAKRGEIVIEAFRIARKRDPNLVLLIVGEAAPDIDISKIAGPGVITTGYVDDREFGAYYAAADRLVNLRYPSAGETSGTLIRAFGAGKPVAVSDYAQFAEYPDTCVVKIPFGEGEVETLASFFTRELDERSIAAAQRDWLAKNATIEQTVAGYVSAVILSREDAPAAQDDRSAGLPLFPSIELVGIAREDGRLRVTVRNTGETTLRAREYGQPAYRIIAKQFVSGVEIENRWIGLDGDLRAGEAGTIAIPAAENADRLELHHALQSIPVAGSTPSIVVELTGVR